MVGVLIVVKVEVGVKIGVVFILEGTVRVDSVIKDVVVREGILVIGENEVWVRSPGSGGSVASI